MKQALILESPRLRLRDVALRDRDALLDMWSREVSLRHSLIDPPTAASVTARIDRATREHERDPRAEYVLMAIDKASGTLVGEAFLTVRNPAWQQAEIGWGVRHDVLGRGLATEIGSTLLNFGFGRLGMHRIYAQCRVENAASRRIMVKLGMSEEGVLRENVVAHGARWSSAQSSILASEWRDVERRSGAL